MNKIVFYEIRRLLLSKIYLALLFLTLVFSYYVLRNHTILGTAYTAPFSRWSYASFLSSVVPFLIVSIIFFCTYVFSKQELAVRTITLSTPLSMTTYYITKGIAIWLAFSFTSILVIGLSFAFYAYGFKFYNYADFLQPILLVLIPPALFFFGFGMLAGLINNGWQYVLIVLAFIFGNLNYSPIPGYGEVFSIAFFENYPIN